MDRDLVPSAGYGVLRLTQGDLDRARWTSKRSWNRAVASGACPRDLLASTFHQNWRELLRDGELDGELSGLSASNNWGLVRTVTRKTIDALASGGSPEDLDAEEVASSVLSEVLGATQGVHLVRLMRDAEAAGLVSPVVVPDVDLDRPSYVLAGEDDAFRAMAVAAVPVLEKVAAFELSKVASK